MNRLLSRRSLAFVCAALIAVLITAFVEPALAAFGPAMRTPPGGKPTKRGDMLTVTSDWVDAPGYHPIRFQLDTSGAAGDRTLTIEFRAQEWYGSPVLVSFDLDVPAGAKQVVKTVPVPQYHPWQFFNISVNENGRLYEELSGPAIGPGNFTGQWQPGWPSLLIVESATINNEYMGLAMLVANGSGVIANANATATGQDPTAVNFTSPNMHLSKPGDLPAEWIYYTGFDMIALSLTELKALKEQQPKVFDCIRSWAAMGGNLMVHGVDHAGVRNRLGDLLDLPLAMQEANTTARPAAWRPAEADPNNQVAAGAFAVRDFYRGVVVAIKGDKPYATGSGLSQEIRDTLEIDRSVWHRRWGVSTMGDNHEFWNLLIPGVGLAPVNAYRIMITLFVIFIGPLNYGLLVRYKRLHLLMFTVPASAVLVSVALVGYALASDGLETRVRARTFTEIDQRREEAYSTGRLSYYAGLAPSEGMVFPADAAVIPIDPQGQYQYYRPNRSGQRSMSWRDDQHLTRGWLNSRTPTQYMVGRVSPSKLRLDVTRGEAAVEVQNQLGVEIEQLLVLDEKGGRHYAESIPVEGNARLTAVPAELTGNDQHPFGAINQSFLRTMPRDTRQYAYNYSYTPQPGMPDDANRVTAANSRMEQAFVEFLQTPGQNNRPRTYVALVKRNPHLPLGVEGVRESDSLHVIVGYW